MVRGNRRDSNQIAIRDTLRQAGYFVFDTADCKNGFPDLLVVSKSGITVLMELKMPGGKLTDDERAFMQNCGAIYHVCYHEDDALAYMSMVDRMRVR